MDGSGESRGVESVSSESHIPPKYGWSVKMDHKFSETWNQNIRPRLRQIPDLLPLFIRYMMTGKQIYGVPLGGIGSGTIGRGFKGEFCRFQMTPGLYTYDVAHADQFILSVREPNGGPLLYQKVLSGAGPPPSRILSTWDWTFNPSDGTYLGLYPKAYYTYHIPEQNLILQCKQISPVIPHNYKDSCMPASVFVWGVQNNSTSAKEISITFTFKNGTGSPYDKKGKCASQTFSGDGEENGQKIVGVALDQKYQDINLTYGIGCLQKENQTITNMTQFDVKSGGDLWQKLTSTGKLDSESSTYELKRGEVGVAVSCSSVVTPNQAEEIVFSLVWHQPVITFKGRLVSHVRRYSKFLNIAKNSSINDEDNKETTDAVQSLTTYTLNNYIKWDKEISTWQDSILNDMKLPNWFKSAIFNELYFISDGGSVWLEYNSESLPRSTFNEPEDIRHEVGRFAYLEAHEYRMYNTYDVHFYASFALAMLWPKLQLSFQYDTADAVKYRDDTVRTHLFDGHRSARKQIDSVTHDVGDPSEDPFLKVNSYRIHDVSEWRDLNLKFVLQVYRDFQFTKDKTFLNDMLPICSDVMKKSMSWDTDGDGLIENSGSADQTYDTWIMTGASAYCGGLWLASLFAMIEMLKISDKIDSDVRKSDQLLYEETLSRGKKSYHEKLWTGEYYKFDSSNASHGNSIMADQLCGHWFLSMCDVDTNDIFPRQNVNRALRTLFEKNVKGFCDGELGAVNGMTADGSIDYFTMQSEEVWTGVTYSLASTMIHNGMIDEGFKTAEGIYRTVYEKIGMGYETPEALYSTKKI